MWEAVIAIIGLAGGVISYLRGRANNSPFVEALEEASKANEALAEKYKVAMARVRTLENLAIRLQRKYNETLTDSELIDLANNIAGLPPSGNGNQGAN